MLTALADLFLGATCPGCGRPDWRLCADCRAVLAQPRLLRRIDGLPVVALVDYEGVGGAVIRSLKDAHAWGNARWCAVGLARATALLPQAVLVPVPSSREAVRRRGFDHAAALARLTARRSRRAWRPLLRRVSRRVDQAGLGVADRTRNQIGSMQARATPDTRAGLGRASVVLVDDVCTTGATLLEARRALTAAGWRVEGAVVVAHARLRSRRHLRASGEFQMTDR